MELVKMVDNQVDELKQQMADIGARAKEAAAQLADVSPEDKNIVLRKAANYLRESVERLLTANNKDLKAAEEAGLDKAMIDRLTLTPERIGSIAMGLENIATLDDPVGMVLSEWDRPNGLNISRVSVPLGVIGIIYESRPNVTADAGALCLKSGNAAILRGGSDSFYSSQAIVKCLHTALKDVGLPQDAIQLVPTTDRAAVGEMLTMVDTIDIIVPRGGKGLCQRVQEESRIPTLQHLDGNCHTYIHESANLDMAVEVVVNAKLRRPGICGATESLVIDEKIIDVVLPRLLDALEKEGCEVRGDARAQSADARVTPASEQDWDTEYLDTIISVKTSTGSDEAIAFVNQHSSHHTDAIITEDDSVAGDFLAKVDSAIVMHNTSTQFADGGEFGMGAEIGISTGRLHARGPVGVEQLTTYKYVVKGSGQIRPKA